MKPFYTLKYHHKTSSKIRISSIIIKNRQKIAMSPMLPTVMDFPVTYHSRILKTTYLPNNFHVVRTAAMLTVQNRLRDRLIDNATLIMDNTAKISN